VLGVLPDRKRNMKTKRPTILVIFGATGDLVAKKALPALFSLYQDRHLPDTMHFVAFSRRDWETEDYREYAAKLISEGSKEARRNFLELFSHVRGEFDSRESYKTLSDDLHRHDEMYETCANKLFYLAVPPEYYNTIFEELSRSGLTKPCGASGHTNAWTRVLVEKPFGKNLDTARALDEKLGKLFSEDQIYRIDHYLGKEMLQNILVFRFSNNLLEDSWNNKYVEKITVRFLESGGVETRGAFYDGVGALRDVGQNHILQMLALSTMNAPSSLSSEAIRQERSEVLKKLANPIPEKLANNSYRAQYEGYTDAEGVSKGSQTETYFKLVTHIDSPRWRGVPVILEAGKALPEDRKEIVIDFKRPAPCFCPPDEREGFKNKVIFSMEPDNKITVDLWAKSPGIELNFVKRVFELPFSHGEEREADAYERLLIDAINGDQTLFVSTPEVNSMWEFVDPILAAWSQGVVPLERYKKNSEGPMEATKEILEKASYGFHLQSEAPKRLRREIAIVGLGKMGGSMARNLLDQGWRVVGYNRSEESTHELMGHGLDGAFSVKELTEKLTKPRLVWVMVPAGEPTDQVLAQLVGLLDAGDTVIDGGNSNFNDSVRHHKEMAGHNINFLDVGVSGGQEGARHGACLMIGGREQLYEALLPLFRDLAAPGGFAHFEEPGAGHFVKMVHNGIEYGMMQAIAEGFNLMKESEYNLDLVEVARVYNSSSIIESRLVGWLGSGFHEYGVELTEIDGRVAHSGEGKWTVETAEKMGIEVPVIKASFDFRLASDQGPSYTGKAVMVMRNQFGGHSVKKK